MSIKYSVFLKWAIDRFGEENVQAKGKEVKINSIFEADDTGYHLWCSPSGGKKKHKYGVYHCFKTDKTGSLVKLVQLVDSCDKNDALETLQGKTTIRELEKKLEEFFKSRGLKSTEYKLRKQADGTELNKAHSIGLDGFETIIEISRNVG